MNIHLSIDDRHRAFILLRKMDEMLKEFFRPPLNAHPQQIIDQMLRIDADIREASILLEEEESKISEEFVREFHERRQV